MKKFFLFLLLFVILGGLWAYQNFFSDRNNVSHIPQIGEVPIYVADQRPGSLININFTSLIKAGFVVMHENNDGKFGKVIGNSKILPAGNYEGISIGLIRPTIHSESLFAVIYEDSGDKIFSPGLDVPFKDEDGNVIFTRFNIDQNATRIQVPPSASGPDVSDKIRLEKPAQTSACKVGGCSGQLCVEGSEEDVVTTCEYKAEYACYKNAKCERQEDGKCGWTPTEQLITCLRSAWESEATPQ